MRYFNETLLARNSKVAVNLVYGLTYRDLRAGDRYTFYGFGATGHIILEVTRHPEYDSSTGSKDYVDILVKYEHEFTGKRRVAYEKKMVSMANGDYKEVLMGIWKKYSDEFLKTKKPAF